MVAIRNIWICNDDEFDPSKYKLYALFRDDIMASYFAEFGTSKQELFALFFDGFTASYHEELCGPFIGDHEKCQTLEIIGHK